MGRIARAVPGVDAWELWNEPDSGQFWAGGADPPAYAALLRAAYPAIKAAQPSDVVVTGGMVGNNFDFLAALYANGARGAFDAVGVHTDTACLTDGPDAYYRDPRGRIGRYTFSAYREVHAGDGRPRRRRQADLDDRAGLEHAGRPVCPVGEKAGTKPLGVSPKRQARYLRAAYRCLAADPVIGVALWFGIQDIRGSRHAGGFGLYRSGGRAKPAAKAFRKLDKGIRPRRGCGGYVDRTPPTIKRRPARRPGGGSRTRSASACARTTTAAGRGSGGSAWRSTAQHVTLVALARLDLAVVGERGLDARRPHAHLHRQGPREQRDDDVGAGRQAAPRLTGLSAGSGGQPRRACARGRVTFRPALSHCTRAAEGVPVVAHATMPRPRAVDGEPQTARRVGVAARLVQRDGAREPAAACACARRRCRIAGRSSA